MICYSNRLSANCYSLRGKKQQGGNIRDGLYPADSMQLVEKILYFEVGMQMILMDEIFPISSKKRNVIFACEWHPQESSLPYCISGC